MLHKSAHTYTHHSVASVLSEMKFKIASVPFFKGEKMKHH